VLMDQLPPDSHSASLSHTLPSATAGASDPPPPPPPPPLSPADSSGVSDWVDCCSSSSGSGGGGGLGSLRRRSSVPHVGMRMVMPERSRCSCFSCGLASQRTRYASLPLIPYLCAMPCRPWPY